MSILTSILAYTLVILFSPLVLLFYREFARALLCFICNLTVVGIPVAMLIGVITVREHRRPAQKVQEPALP